MGKLYLCLVSGFLAAACSTSEGPGDGEEVGGEDQPAPEDDVVDESAGEDALAVVKGEAPGVSVIAEYAEGADVDQVTEALAAEYGLLITARYHDLGGAAFIAPDQHVAEQLRLDTRVIGLSEDRLVTLSPGDAFAADIEAYVAEATAAGQSDDADASSQVRSNGFRLIHAERAPGNGSGTRVAVLDSGVHGAHADLEAAMSADYGKDCIRRTNKTTFDFNGHGTHVAGIIAAQNNSIGMIGVAPRTKIVPIRVLDPGGHGTNSSLLCGVDYVARRADRIHVVNVSLGGRCSGPCPPMPHHRAIRKLVASGVTVVAAAGNEGEDADHFDPAFIDEVITVSAYMDLNGFLSSSDRYAPFSNWGPGVDIGAPGLRIFSTVPGSKYARMDGTSMAAPFVAGAAAVLEQTTGGSPADIRSAMLAAALTDYPGRGDPHHPERLLQMPSIGTSGTGECGDAVCDTDEDDVNCAADCGCAASACDAGPAPFGCWCDDECEARGDCCSDADICPIM